MTLHPSEKVLHKPFGQTYTWITLCRNIKENLYLVKDDALTFEKSNVDSLKSVLEKSLNDRDGHLQLAAKAKERVLKEYSWETITDQYLELFKKSITK